VANFRTKFHGRDALNVKRDTGTGDCSLLLYRSIYLSTADFTSSAAQHVSI